MNSLGIVSLLSFFIGLTPGVPTLGGTRDDDRCAIALFGCSPPRLPQTRGSLYDDGGQVNMDCSNATLQADRACVEGIRDACPGSTHQSMRSRFMNQLEIKEALCSNQGVVVDGRDCMEVADETQVLRDCDLCDHPCLTEKLGDLRVCRTEHISFALEIATIYTRNNNMCPTEQHQQIQQVMHR